MEFGKLENVDRVDWSLPPTDPIAVEYLARFEERRLRVRFGAPAWAHREWVGSIYPPKTKSTEYLHFYSRYFSCIELNTSHYRIPTADQTAKWRAQVPLSFKFCAKMFQGISHERHGLLNQSLIQAWWDFLEHLGENRGPSFLQLPPHFDYSMKSELFSFLQKWPPHFQLALEFRHPSWFEHGRIRHALTQYLQTRAIGLVITDVGGRRDVLHSSISAPFSLLRFIGNDLHSSDFSRAQAWAERFSEWESEGLQELYLFIHEPEDIHTPEMTEFFLSRLQQVGGWNLKPAFMQPQLNLGD